MKITCLIDALSAGGAQRVITQLAGGLTQRGHNVTVATLNPSIPDFYETPPGVTRVRLPLAAGIQRWFDLRSQINRLSALREGVRRLEPDIIISFMDTTNILALAVCPHGHPPIIACERVNPRYNGIGPHWLLLRRLLYPRAAKVVMLTNDALQWARSLHPKWNVTAFPNPVIPPVFSRNAPRPDFMSGQRNLLALGRLTRQKGFDLLLRTFSGLKAGFPDWQLTILGEGPERTSLEAMILDLGLKNRVAMPGVTARPFDALKYADLFVMSSRYEGFPNALTEAMSCGVPAVSFDCPSGPSDIIRNGTDGLLVPAGDLNSLAAALSGLMSDEAGRKRMAEKATDVIERFGMKKYLDTWEGLINKAARG